MPAGSDAAPAGVPDLPRTWRPVGPRIAAVVFSVVLIGAFLGLWYSFDEETKQAVTVLQRCTIGFFVFIGVALMYAMARSRITADERGLTVVNGYRKREYEWAEVVAVRMPPGAPWPTLDLADGNTVSAMGVHGSDGAPARRAVAEIRALLDRS
ncbi:hypothetical protein HNR19_002228 [Nocardioides thalensis]|uniref:Low molecular weight protein antigen 6 PH domain-containing protein n=1 Tax=Nocardioides thalensis TaxID=1914755 RepID=A0A853BZX7_9ACTN|nr:PH domain-containing protein [Nocardioides thalensis]NYJ01530.1 hypothetical protein [Nocardioides thalensis]